MSTKDIVKRIIYEGRNWTLYDWKAFRCLDEYWSIRDDYVRRLNSLEQKKDWITYNALERDFKIWKLKGMVKFNKNRL
jgi:hypothetical protein